MKAWSEFLSQLENKLGQSIVDKWLKPLKVAHFDSANLYLEADDPFQIAWFEEYIRPRLKLELLSLNAKPIKVHLKLSSSSKSPIKSPLEKKLPITFTADLLSEQMTLESFVAGDSNAPLMSFLSELITPPSAIAPPNPIYIFGPAGSGKTHLLTALTHAFRAKNKNVLYTNTETFTQHVVSAIRASEMHAFRKHYRHSDILIIDNVHELSRRYATQEEFFHTFNTLHGQGKQIILSANCLPSHLKEIEPRLTSRCEWGINLAIQKLASCDFKNFLKKRTESLQFFISEEASDFLITHFSDTSSLSRALETLILRCHLDSSLQPERLQTSQMESLLISLLEEQRKQKLSFESIQQQVCKHYGIKKSDLLGKSHRPECSLPRQIAIYLCRKELKLPFQSIGRLFERDHSTVMSSVRLIEKRVDNFDPEVSSFLSQIKEELIH